MSNTFLCIDLKTFYASVECIERGLDPFYTNLVVADKERGKGTITLAISSKLKAQGIKNRCRIYEIPNNIKYIVAKPRMQLYIDYAAKIYEIYLRYISKDDIHPYSIDEMFLDITSYLKLYNMAKETFAKFLLDKIYEETKLYACAGIGDNLYLAKIALDMLAKKAPQGIAYLSQKDYQDKFLDYTPLTDFWQISTGISDRLARRGIYTFRELLNYPEDLIYQEFGVNAEILLDHAKGVEETTISDIKKYIPKAKCLSNSQVLFRDYKPDEALTILIEMVDLMSLQLAKNNLIGKVIYLSIGYSKNEKSSSGQATLAIHTNLFSELKLAYTNLFNKLINRDLLVRKIGISIGLLLNERYQELNLFIDPENAKKEQKLANAINELKAKFGKNIVLKGVNYKEEATQRMRNTLIGGHSSGKEND